LAQSPSQETHQCTVEFDPLAMSGMENQKPHRASEIGSTIFVWVDVFSLNLHESVSDSTLTHLLDAITRSTFGTLVIVDENASVLERLWCLWEMYAIVVQKTHTAAG